MNGSIIMIRIRRMVFSVMLGSMVLVTAYVSEELSASIIKVTRIPEDDILHSHRRENLKSYMITIILLRWTGVSNFWCRQKEFIPVLLGVLNAMLRNSFGWNAAEPWLPDVTGDQVGRVEGFCRYDEMGAGCSGTCKNEGDERNRTSNCNCFRQ
jgi:hypothetical protein